MQCQGYVQAGCRWHSSRGRTSEPPMRSCFRRPFGDRYKCFVYTTPYIREASHRLLSSLAGISKKHQFMSQDQWRRRRCDAHLHRMHPEGSAIEHKKDGKIRHREGQGDEKQPIQALHGKKRRGRGESSDMCRRVGVQNDRTVNVHTIEDNTGCSAAYLYTRSMRMQYSSLNKWLSTNGFSWLHPSLYPLLDNHDLRRHYHGTLSGPSHSTSPSRRAQPKPCQRFTNPSDGKSARHVHLPNA